MKYITVLIEYEDDQHTPSFHADMEALGGKVAGVQFNDALKEIEDLEEKIEKASREGRL